MTRVEEECMRRIRRIERVLMSAYLTGALPLSPKARTEMRAMTDEESPPGDAGTTFEERQQTRDAAAAQGKHAFCTDVNCEVCNGPPAGPAT